MKNQNLFNGYIPFYNKGFSNILQNPHWDIYNKDNNKNNQNQNINLFKKGYKSRIPIINHKSHTKQYELDKTSKNETKEEGNLFSCPNAKNNNILFKKISYNSNNMNSIETKLYELKNKNHNIRNQKTLNIDNYQTKLNTDNYNFQLTKKQKEREREIEIEKIKYLMKQKEDRTFHSLARNRNYNKKNNTLNNDRLNNCFTIFSLKVQPLCNEKKITKTLDKTIDKTIDTQNKLSNKILLKKKNIKIASLPKMNKSNFVKEKLSIPKIEDKYSNTPEKVKSKTHNQELKNLLHQIEKRRNKIKNLVSFDALTLPGTENGKQKINQDSYLVIPNVNNSHNCKIFGVFDGHGDNGDTLSQEIRDYFIEYFTDNHTYNQESKLTNENFMEIFKKVSNDDRLEKVYNLFTKNNYNELSKLYGNINDKIHNKYKENEFCLKTGSTSNIVIVINDKKKDSLNKIITINLGDSKSLLITQDNQTIDLNMCHIPEEASEKERIEKNGGEVSRVDWADYGPLRVFFKGENYPGLAMTRSFGDFEAEPLGVNSIPDIREYDMQDKKPKILVLATDGIWQFLSNEKVKNILLPYYEENNITGASQKLVSSALRMWEAKNPDFIDDITVILLFFK